MRNIWYYCLFILYHSIGKWTSINKQKFYIFLRFFELFLTF
nr:MAG TPA: hypothetical protein [Caudoviricetes sp.]